VHCRRARKAIIEARLALLSDAVESRLREHLASCDACSAEARMDDALDRELARLGHPAPVRVDVARHVLREIDSFRAVDRRAVTPRQLAWAWVWAYAFALTVAIMGAGILMFVPKDLPNLGHFSDGIPAAASALAQPFALAFVALKALGRAALELIELISVLLLKIQPVAQFVMMLALVLMAAVTTFVIGKDLRLFPALARKEHG
jgi:anti-sigma factor RsiW